MRGFALVALGCLVAVPASAQSPADSKTPSQQEKSTSPGEHAQPEDRVHARFRSGARTGTNVNQSQAEALTLTLSAVSLRPVQNWIRTAGTIDRTGRVLTGLVSGADAALVKAGQRVRALDRKSTRLNSSHLGISY